MERELGLFPLNLVVFPGEKLNLHVFEPRYKQLVQDCITENTTFGIPSYINKKLEMGTEVKIQEISRTYDDGRMDIKTVGVSSFTIVDFQNPWKNRLYGGGLIKEEFFDDREDADVKLRLVDLVSELFNWLCLEETICFDQTSILYKIVHKVGLKPEEEYELLKMPAETERQSYVIEHLKRVLPALERAEKAKERIQLNGHFQHLDPLKF